MRLRVRFACRMPVSPTPVRQMKAAVTASARPPAVLPCQLSRRRRRRVGGGRRLLLRDDLLRERPRRKRLPPGTNGLCPRVGAYVTPNAAEACAMSSRAPPSALSRRTEASVERNIFAGIASMANAPRGRRNTTSDAACLRRAVVGTHIGLWGAASTLEISGTHAATNTPGNRLEPRYRVARVASISSDLARSCDQSRAPPKRSTS